MPETQRTARPNGDGRRGRPPGSTAEETVPRLVEAAQVQFGTHGYAGARMTAIAKAAGITHSSIYQYFTSKQELYRAAFDAALAEPLPEYIAAIDTEATLKEQIQAIFRASARAHARKPTITPFLASIPMELRRHPDLMAPLQAESAHLMAPLHAMFAAARARGEIAEGIDDMDLVLAFLGAVMGVGLFSYGVPDGRMDAAVDILLSVLDGDFFKAGRKDA